MEGKGRRRRGGRALCGPIAPDHPRLPLHTLTNHSHSHHTRSISLCRYGGPVALLRDDRKLVRVQTGADARPLVRTYSASGARLAEWEWDGGLVAGMGWTDEEDLCVVSVSGGAKLYTPLADEPPRTLTLGSDAFKDGVTKTAFYGSGFVALTGSNALLCADGAPPSARVAPLSPPPRGRVTALAALPPLPGTTSGVRAVVAVASEEGGAPSSLATCDSGGTIVVATSPSPYAHVAASPCGGFVAAVTDDGRLTVWGASFGAPLSEFAAAGGATPPHRPRVVWRRLCPPAVARPRTDGGPLRRLG